MALNATRLAGSKATDDIWITLVDPNCVERNMLALLGSEWLLIGNTIGSLIGTTPPRATVGVVPGYSGSTAAPHSQNEPVLVGRPYDFAHIGLIPPATITSQSFGGTWEFLTGPRGLAGTTPTADTLIFLTSQDASGNYQLSPPQPDQTNTLTLVSLGAGQASVHYANGFNGNSASVMAGLPVGSLLTLRAHNGTWLADSDAGSVTFP